MIEGPVPKACVPQEGGKALGSLGGAGETLLICQPLAPCGSGMAATAIEVREHELEVTVTSSREDTGLGFELPERDEPVRVVERTEETGDATPELAPSRQCGRIEIGRDADVHLPSHRPDCTIGQLT